MHPTESLEKFYKDHPEIKKPSLVDLNKAVGHFNVYPRGKVCHALTVYHRRDFYKISLIHGGGTLNYADKTIAIGNSALVFSNPAVPYSWEPAPVKQTGYFCLFTEDFISNNSRNESFIESPLFKIGGDPVYFVDEDQVRIISRLFVQMMETIDSDYIYKYDLLRNYVNLIVHEAH
ncbi:MAG TPA: AraC family transcriptional regulator, partial [Puia sp.]|nr:AraC family transcriptional regulator [Puia sp.]